jgi:hypothetical protein
VSSSSLMLMHGTNYQQCSTFVLGLGVLKLFNTLNSSDWLRVHSVPDSINMVHQSSSNVCEPLIIDSIGIGLLSAYLVKVHLLGDPTSWV